MTAVDTVWQRSAGWWLLLFVLLGDLLGEVVDHFSVEEVEGRFTHTSHTAHSDQSNLVTLGRRRHD